MNKNNINDRLCRLMDILRKYNNDEEKFMQDPLMHIICDSLSDNLQDLYVIVLRKKNSPDYVKLCTRSGLQTPRIETGLFNHRIINDLRVWIVNPEHTWQTFLKHIPGVQDLRWNNL